MEQMLIGIFSDIDDFCKAFEEYWNKHLVTDGRKIIPKCGMSLSEIMTITYRQEGRAIAKQSTFREAKMY